MSSRKKSNLKAAGTKFLPTIPSSNTAATGSHPRNLTTEPAGSDFLQTSPTSNTAATGSHPRNPMTEPAGSDFLQTSNTAATGSLPGSPITMAPGSAFLPTTPTRTAAIHSSNIPGTLVGYVHNISPVKRNKRDTLDYSTFKLQLGEKFMQEALCYSPSKRAIFS